MHRRRQSYEAQKENKKEYVPVWSYIALKYFFCCSWEGKVLPRNEKATIAVAFIQYTAEHYQFLFMFLPTMTV